jgi:hypothetical protein
MPQVSTLPGTLRVYTAFVSYCGPLDCVRRRKCLRRWRRLLDEEGIGCQADFQRLPLVAGVEEENRGEGEENGDDGGAVVPNATAAAGIPRLMDNLAIIPHLPQVSMHSNSLLKQT